MIQTVTSSHCAVYVGFSLGRGVLMRMLHGIALITLFMLVYVNSLRAASVIRGIFATLYGTVVNAADPAGLRDPDFPVSELQTN